MGPRVVTNQEFDEAFTGVVLAFEPGPDFQKGGKKRSILAALARRLTGSGRPLVYIMLVSLALVVPGIVIPVFTKVFVDNYLVHGMSDWVRPLPERGEEWARYPPGAEPVRACGYRIIFHPSVPA